jgi:hypothetical protein
LNSALFSCYNHEQPGDLTGISLFIETLPNKQAFFSFRTKQQTESKHMAELITNPTVISAEDALRTEIILNQAIIDILITKKIISEDELITGIKKIKNERESLANDWESLL